MTEPAVWLVLRLSLEALRHGFRIIGSPGAGKSVLLKIFRASLAKLMGDRPIEDVLLVDFDPKRDLYELYRLFPDVAPVYDLNPFAWGDRYHFMGDFVDPRDIGQAAANLIDAAANSSQPFFPQAAQQVFKALALRHWLVCPEVTTFRDLVLSAYSAQNMRRVARSHPNSRHVLSLLNKTEAGLSVIATLLNEVGKYEHVAALYHTNDRGRDIWVEKFLAHRFGVMSLPYDDKSVAVLAAIVRYILLVLQQRCLSDGAKRRLVILLLDELALVPGGVNLDLGIVKGREAGLVTGFAYQSQTHCRAVHGKERFDATSGMLKTTIVLNQPNREDAEYCAKIFGDHQGFITVESVTRGGGGGGKHGGGPSTQYGKSEQFTTLENVTASMIQSLTVPTPADPVIRGVMATLPYKPFLFELPIPDLFARLVPPVKPKAPPAPRSPKDFVIRPFTADDLRRLKLPPRPPRK